EIVEDIAVDNNGSAYIAGRTNSDDFPTINAYRDWLVGSTVDCFVTKFSPDGSSLEYSTFIGGSGSNGANGIAVDSNGAAVIVGTTTSIDFPQYPYEAVFQNNDSSANTEDSSDLAKTFIAKFHPQGSSLLFSKVIDGGLYDSGIAVAVDSNYGIYILGETKSTDFPTYNAFQPQYGGGDRDMFVMKYYYPDPIPLLTLTSPNGGESWKGGTQQNITWTSTGLDDQRVRLLLYKGGTQVGVIADNLPISPGSRTWTVGDYEGGTATHGEDYQIRIETANGDYHDTSASFFKISNPSITVTAPNGGQTLQAGDTYTVTWAHVGAIGLVDIDLSTNNGTTWQEVEYGVTNIGSYDWTVTNVHSNQCLIRVKDAGSTTRDTSDAVFTIIGLPGITLTAPNGGEILTAGFAEMITWTSQNVTGTITIDLYKAGVFYVSLGSADVAGGSIELGIPLDVTWGTDFTIRIHQGAVQDFSDAPVICRHHYVFHGKDFIGDNAEEFAIYRPSTGRWCINGTPSVAWGVATDVPVPGNYDTDDKTDIAIYRPSTGRWCVLGQASIAYGTRTDIPVPGDYDGDGKTDIAIYRPSTGRFSVLNQNSVPVGPPESIPVPADYDGDGATDFAVFTPSTGYWTIHGQENVRFGIATDIPVPADYDGDGKAEIAVFRPSTGRWCIMGQPSIPWGTSTDIPVPGDYDGDGDDDIAIFRPSNGQWSVLGSTSVLYGSPGDIPLVTHNR
ncbi:MAG: hypothetical protein GY765_07640, partial [bacterium]|nr:hypothetical protein [bacterium]